MGDQGPRVENVLHAFISLTKPGARSDHGEIVLYIRLSIEFWRDECRNRKIGIDYILENAPAVKIVFVIR